MIVSVSKRDRFENKSTSKGTQLKWYKEGYFIKSDKKSNYEGLAEVICQTILCNMYNPFGFARYGLCSVQEGSKSYRGCISPSFLGSGEQLITFDRMLSLKDDSYISKLESHAGLKDEVTYALDCLVNMFIKYYNINIFEYLNIVFMFDLLVVNEDRHMNNLGMIVDNIGKLTFSPIFDNGMSLFSDVSKYRVVRDVNRALRKAEFQPFGVSYADFYKACISIGMKPLSIDVDGMINSLNRLDFGLYEGYRQRVLNIVESRLSKERGSLYC